MQSKGSCEVKTNLLGFDGSNVRVRAAETSSPILTTVTTSAANANTDTDTDTNTNFVHYLYKCKYK